MTETDTNNLNNNTTTDNKKDKTNINYIEQNDSNNLYSLIKIFIILVLYLIIYYFLGNFLPSPILAFINLFVIVFFVVFVIVNFINYFFNFNILKEIYYVIFNIKYDDEIVNKLFNSIVIFNNTTDNVTNNNVTNNNMVDNDDNSGLIDEEKEIELDNQINELKSSNKTQEPTDISNVVMNKEVFHVPGSRFTYNDANAICKSMNADLASYEQLQNAHKNGANWCSYGWSQEQLALYPTSQNKFDELSINHKTKYDCGFVGVNGMYVNNPYMKFGANCYGVKPKKSDLELKHSEVSDYKPKTAKEVIFDDRVEYWKRRLGNVLVAPFNKDKWYNIE